MPQWLNTLLQNRLLGFLSVVLIIIAGALHGMGQSAEQDGKPTPRSARMQKVAVVLFILGALMLVFTGPFKFWQRP